MPVIQVEARNGVVGLRVLRFLFDADRFSCLVKGDDAVSLRIVDLISEYDCTVIESSDKPIEPHLAVKDIVPQNQTNRFARDEFLADEKGLRNPLGFRLYFIGNAYPPAASITHEGFKARRIARRGNDQNIIDPRHHQGSQRIVNHRFVINRLQLFTRYQS